MTFSADIEALPQRIETEPAARAPTPLPVPVISAITVAAIIALWGLASAGAVLVVILAVRWRAFRALLETRLAQ